MHLNSKLLFKKYAVEHFAGPKKVLEVGPDGFPSTYQTMAGNPSLQWDTTDMAKFDWITYPGAAEYSLPIPDEQYDVVMSAQVIEHVRKPWVWMKELVRVCKVGGKVITINPVSWPYHEAPIDCWRAFPEGMKALYEDSNLKVLLCKWESLEVPNYKRYIPGRSPHAQQPRLRTAYAFLGKFGFPVERAEDTITIGVKE